MESREFNEQRFIFTTHCVCVVCVCKKLIKLSRSALRRSRQPEIHQHLWLCLAFL